jgi:PAS domain S-box-containing protein
MDENEYTSVPFKLFFENAGLAAILLMDKEGNIFNQSKGIEIAYGYTKSDLYGKNFSLLFTPEDRMKKRPEIELTTVLQKGSMSDNNYVVHKDGTYIWSNGETVRMMEGDGIKFLVKIIYDINHQKLLEKFLLNANMELSNKCEELMKVNNDLDTFVYTASHDLKAPINNIEALVTMVNEGLSEECRKNVKEIMEMIQVSINKFQSVILDLAKIGKSKAEDNKTEKIYFTEILDDVKSTLSEEIRSSGAVITEDFAVPETSEYSRTTLRSIFHNLISNSIKYRSPERNPEIMIASKGSENNILLLVSDNGIGIKEADKEKIFGIYERGHDHVEGSGLGLSIVKRIIDNRGGKIELESQEGKGSVFKIYLMAN